jgi:hypothetical protein
MRLFGYGYLWAWSSPVGNLNRVFLTIDRIPPRSNVYATCALTSVSLAIAIDSDRQETLGQVGVAIKRWGVYNDDGSIRTEERTVWEENARYIEDCASVTFELMTSGGVGYATVSVYLDN